MTRAVDAASDRPVFKQIADSLRERISTGELEPGAQLPSEQDLIESFGVARGTVRQSIALLKTEGLVVTEHGRGAFVRPRPPVRRLAHDRFARKHRRRGKAAFTVEAEAAGAVPSVDMLTVQRESATAEVAAQLGIRPGSKVVVRRRRYLSDGEPVEFAVSYLPLDLAGGTQIEDDNPGPGGIYARLEEAGHVLKRFTEDLSARMPRPDEARTLQLRPGVPVLHLVRVAYARDGRAVEVCDTLMAADRFVLGYELPAT